MFLRWRSVVAVLFVVLAACGGGGGIDEHAVDPAPGGGRVEDTALARTIVLQEADMPAGWEGVTHTEDPAERERSRALAECLGRPDPETTRSAMVHGQDLSMGQTQVSSSATILTTVEEARATREAVQGPGYHECLIASFRENLRRQAPEARVENVAAAPLEVESFGDATVGTRLTAELVYPDRTDRLFADLVYIAKDRSTVSATFFSFAEPFPPELRQSLVARLGNRVATA